MTEKTDKQQAIFDKIIELKDRLEDYRCEMTSLYVACEGLVKERDAAIQRAEKAERDFKALCQQTDQRESELSDQFTLLDQARIKAEAELAEQKERAKTGRIHAMQTNNRLREALRRIAHIEANRFPDTSTWKDLASEAIDIARAALTPKEGKESDKYNSLLSALKLYGNPENWRFTHDKDGNLLWVTSLGPDYAIEILNGIEGESSEEKEIVRIPGDGTLIIKKGNHQ